MKKQFFDTKKMILASLLIAMSIILSRVLGLYLPMGATTKRISFESIPIFLGSIYLGAPYGALIGALTDILGSLMFPKGDYNFLFTIAPIINGIIPALVFNKKYTNLVPKIILACVLQSIVSNTLNSYFLSILYGKNTFMGHLYARIPLGTIMIAVKTVVLVPLIHKLKGFMSNQNMTDVKVK